jgi:hypothetical protein
MSVGGGGKDQAHPAQRREPVKQEFFNLRHARMKPRFDGGRNQIFNVRRLSLLGCSVFRENIHSKMLVLAGDKLPI